MVLQDHFHAMNKLSNEELIRVIGGANTLTASFLTAISKCIDSLLEVGRSIGSALRRLSSHDICS